VLPPVDHAPVAVIGVERGRQLGRIGGDALGLLGGDGVLPLDTQVDLPGRVLLDPRELLHRRTDQGGDADRLEAEVHPPGLHAAEIQQRFDKTFQPLAFVVQEFVVLPPVIVGRHTPPHEQLGELTQRRQRRSEFV
jgi:hypothetical protein